MFSLERLKKDFVSEEILGLKKVVKKILVGNFFGSKHILGPRKGPIRFCHSAGKSKSLKLDL